jgi:hypothetical protein
MYNAKHKEPTARFDRLDICMAYYLFGYLYHGGQFSKEYAYMGRAMALGFRPGAMGVNFESLSENGQAIFLKLENEYLTTHSTGV